MFIELRSGEQKKLVSRCIKKAGSERKLSKTLLIPNLSIYFYKNELRKMPEERFIKFLQFLNLNVNNELKKVKFLPNNFRQKKGGMMCYRIKVKNGTFKKNLKKMLEKSSKKLSDWHKKMKKKSKKQYFIAQYERFKKVGQYKYFTERGERVRNELEKQVADFLFDLKKNYKYEPYIESNNNVFFPDFLVENKTIIECTMWRGYDKATKLKRKILNLEKSGFKIIVFIDPKVTKFYKSIKNYTIDNLINLREKLN